MAADMDFTEAARHLRHTTNFVSDLCRQVDPTLLLPDLDIAEEHKEEVTNISRQTSKYLACQKLWEYLHRQVGWPQSLATALERSGRYSHLLTVLVEALPNHCRRGAGANAAGAPQAAGPQAAAPQRRNRNPRPGGAARPPPPEALRQEAPPPLNRQEAPPPRNRADRNPAAAGILPAADLQTPPEAQPQPELEPRRPVEEERGPYRGVEEEGWGEPGEKVVDNGQSPWTEVNPSNPHEGKDQDSPDEDDDDNNDKDDDDDDKDEDDDDKDEDDDDKDEDDDDKDEDDDDKDEDDDDKDEDDDDDKDEDTCENKEKDGITMGDILKQAPGAGDLVSALASSEMTDETQTADDETIVLHSDDEEDPPCTNGNAAVQLPLSTSALHAAHGGQPGNDGSSASAPQYPSQASSIDLQQQRRRQAVQEPLNHLQDQQENQLPGASNASQVPATGNENSMCFIQVREASRAQQPTGSSIEDRQPASPPDPASMGNPGSTSAPGEASSASNSNLDTFNSGPSSQFPSSTPSISVHPDRASDHTNVSPADEDSGLFPSRPSRLTQLWSSFTNFFSNTIE